MRIFLAALSVLFLTPTSFAQITVLGSGFARDCYIETKSNHMASRRAHDVCTKALQHENLSLRNKMATYVNRGILSMRAGDHEFALRDFDDAINIMPEEGVAYLNRGAVLIHLNRFSEAIKSLNHSIELDSKDLHAAYYNRALAREKLGDLNAAYYDFKTALEIDPEFEAAEQQLERFILSDEAQG